MREQQGYNLIEIMVGIAVTSLMLGVMTTIVLRVGEGFDGNNSLIKATNQIEQAVGFIASDIRMAKFSDLISGAAPVSTVNLGWTDYYAGSNVGYKSVYSLNGTDLQRVYTVGGVAATSMVGKSISTIAFSISGSLVTVSISTSATSGPKTQNETKTYRFFMRPVP